MMIAKGDRGDEHDDDDDHDLLLLSTTVLSLSQVKRSATHMLAISQ